MNIKLLGTNDWNPMGESFWCVLAKLCKKNNTHWKEARCVIGANRHRSLTTLTGSDSDDETNVDIAMMSELTNWRADQLKSGFSSFYSPYWMSKIHGNKIPTSHRLRLCYTCARLGVHLTIHQFQDITHCPLHGEKLSSDCLNCKEEHGMVRLTDDFPDKALCHNCHWAIWNESATAQSLDVELRTNFVSTYLQWQSQIVEHQLESNKVNRWFGGPTRYSHLAHAHTIVPGPEWVDSCLVGAQSVTIRKSSFGMQHMIEQTSDQSRKVRHSRSHPRVSEATPTESHQVSFLDQFVLAIQRKAETLKNRHPVRGERSGVYEISSDHCVIQNGQGITCWATAHWLWRRCFDAAWPVKEQWSRSRQPVPFHHLTIVREWSSAFTGIATLHDKINVDDELDSVKLMMTNFWIGEWLEAAFYGFVAMACHATDLRALNTNNLGEHIIEFGFNPLFMRFHRLSVDKLVALSLMSNKSTFVELHKSGFQGNDENLLNDFRTLTPLLNAVGLHPVIINRWNIDSEQLRAARRWRSR